MDININGYVFRNEGHFLYLKKSPKIKDEKYVHTEDNIDEFFQNLGITRKIFMKKFARGRDNGVFPYIIGGKMDEAIEYLQSLSKDNQTEPQYEIY